MLSAVTIFVLIFYQKIFVSLQNKLITKTPKETTPSVSPTFIPITLNPTHMDELSQQAKNDTEINRTLEEYKKRTPLLYLMPVETEYFRIEYKGNGKYQITLKGDDPTVDKEEALKWWKEKNIDPSTLEIIWK